MLTMVSQMGSQMSVSEADQEWSEWSVRFEKLLVTGWSVSSSKKSLQCVFLVFSNKLRSLIDPLDLPVDPRIHVLYT